MGISPTKLYRYFKSRNKANLVAGALLLITAVVLVIYLILLIADIPNYWQTQSSLTTNPYDGLIATYLLRSMLIGPILVLFLTSYLLFESHSFGFKISIIISSAFFLVAAFGIVPFLSVFNGILCFLASVIQFGYRKEIIKKDDPITTENLAKFGLRLSGLICMALLVGFFIYLGARGLKYISWDFITGQPLAGGYTEIGKRVAGISNGPIGGLSDAIIGSVMLVGLCELIAIPLGLGAAIYLSEYAPKNKFVETIRFFTETLAGAPSIIIGLFGAALFVWYLGWGISLLAAAFSLAFMILPWNIRVSEEAMKSVPQSYREAAFALGATKWQAIRKTVLLSASPGTITGIMLGIGAALGETAVVLWTGSQAGAAYFFTQGFGLTHSQVPNLATWIYGAYLFISTGLSTKTNVNWEAQNVTFAGAFVLVSMFLIVTVAALVLRNYLAKKTGAM